MNEVTAKRGAPRLHPASVVACACIAVFGAMSLWRFVLVHNATFDLAFYTRMAWGLVRGEHYDPIVGAHVLGLHLSPALIPLGALGAITHTPTVLLLAQTACAAGAAVICGRIGARHLGERWGPWVGALAFALHPNLSHVLGYEFHVGSLALLPLALLADALDRRHAKLFGWAVVGVLACREDFALITFLAALLAIASGGAMRRVGVVVALGSVLYLALFVGVLLPRFGPETGSVQLHFGHLGGSLPSAVLACFTQPLTVLAHLSTFERVTYLPRLLGPLLLLPLLAPRQLLLTAPTFTVALLSQFPTTTKVYSHYFTAALPFLVVGALVSIGRLREERETASRLGPAVIVATVLAYFIAGGGPLAMRAPTQVWASDAQTEAGREMLSRVPLEASVQALDALLPHLAERRTLYRGVEEVGERSAAYWVLDVSHRARYAGRETLLRTNEEPLLREWLSRTDRGLIVYRPPYALFERGADPRAGVAAACFAQPVGDSRRPLTACLDLVGAFDGRVQLVANGACPPDLALRFDGQAVHLICDGVVSPAQLRRGDAVWVTLPEAATTVQAIRASGAPPEPSDAPQRL